MRVLCAKQSRSPVHLSTHYHDSHQMLYVVSGKVAVMLEGEEQIAESGSLVIMNRFEEHSIRVLTPEALRYTLEISAEGMMRGEKDDFLSSVFMSRSRGFRNVIAPRDGGAILLPLLSSMVREFSERTPLCEEKLELLFRIFLIELYRLCPEVFSEETGRASSTVRAVQETLEQRFRDPITLAGLAEEHHVSVSYLAHRFKAVTGYAPGEYLLLCRLSAAKRYLSVTDRPIKEIVDLCGFGDESNFSRIFRLKTGMTPTAFRRQYGAESGEG